LKTPSSIFQAAPEFTAESGVLQPPLYDATRDKNLKPVDRLTPEQRFFVGFAQWACSNERPEDLRVRAATDPHSPPEDRINGVVVNMQEFAQAFACKLRQPMTKPPEKVCKVWYKHKAI
jgi:endothelin-converting enzyme/putative endopeptidase